MAHPIRATDCPSDPSLLTPLSRYIIQGYKDDNVKKMACIRPSQGLRADGGRVRRRRSGKGKGDHLRDAKMLRPVTLSFCVFDTGG